MAEKTDVTPHGTSNIVSTDYSIGRLICYIGILALFWITLLIVSRIAYDWSVVEKMLTRLAMPSGLLLLLMLSITAVGCGLRRYRTAVVWAAAASFFWFCSNTVVANWMGGRLESRYPAVDVQLVEPFDTIIVLGGSTMSDAKQNVWLSSTGDRVMLAARLYHQGKVKHLITTGQVHAWSNRVDMSAATRQIWRELGIPEDAITMVGGVNTAQEMVHLRPLLSQRPTGRVGLLTSAFHLARADRLARREGWQFVPLAAGHQVPMDEPLPIALLPNADAILIVGRASKEYLAALVGR